MNREMIGDSLGKIFSRVVRMVIFEIRDVDQMLTKMWANAQFDGRPAEYRWRPLFKAKKSG